MPSTEAGYKCWRVVQSVAFPLQCASPQDPRVPAQPGRDEDESTSNDLPVTADLLLATIRSEVE